MSSDATINEPVSVWAFFDPTAGFGQVHISPIAILWRRRLVKFAKLIFVASKRVGEVKIVSLVCAAEGANYELEYNSATHLWKLVKVMPMD